MNIPEGITKLDCRGIQTPKLEKGPLSYVKPGSYVSIRPANDDRTYLGIYLGDMPIGVAGIQRKGEEDTIMLSRTQPNPCIFIPQLEQLFYGMESWWGEIKVPEDLHQITDADIESVWYVQALKSLLAKEQMQ
jgi:hypothetical protein